MFITEVKALKDFKTKLGQGKDERKAAEKDFKH